MTPRTAVSGPLVEESPDPLDSWIPRDPVSGAAILANIEDLLPIVSEEADGSSLLGRMTPRMGDALLRAGMYRVGFARHRGGPEVPLSEQTAMIELIARRDAGIAWNAAILAATGFYAGRLGDAAFAELYPDFDRPTCGSFHPRGRADVVDGGFRVTGSWKFGSGIHSSRYILGGVEVFDGGEQVLKDDGSPLVLGVWLPREDVEILDDWQVVGLRGSGSCSYRVRDVLVPAAHSFDRYFTPDADAEPLNKLVDLPFYSTASIAVGIAQHAVDLAAAGMAAKSPSGVTDTRRLALLGEAESYLRAARAVVYAGVARIDAAIFTPGVLPDASTMARGDASVAADLARRIVDLCAELVGSAAIYESTGFDRLLRDLAGVCAHASTWRSRWVDVGRTVLEGSAA
jgi:indole-3-acetate monooxygenase